MHLRKLLHHSLFILFAFNSLLSYSQPSLSYRRLITRLFEPIEIVNAKDGSNRLFVVQKSGAIKVYDKFYNFLGDFVTVSRISTNGERGLLSMTFHPNYKNNGLFFVYYTNSLGDIEISSYKVSNDPNKADTATRTVIITIPHRAASNHNGGKISFGADGYLYFATGDGGSGGDPPNNAQNGKILLGKMLRIDINNTTPPLNYSIPPDNPFVNDTTIADEIWAIGLRNPFRWSFDRLTYDMWIGDVGQGAREEINFSKARENKAVNYGWRCYEGKITHNTAGCKPANQYMQPLFDYNRSAATGGTSVTGGYVYRGSEYPSLYGYYIFSDYMSGNQWTISDSAGSKIMRQLTGTFPRHIAGFGEGEDGKLYACSLTEGAIYKVEAVTGVQVNLLSFTGIARYSIAQLDWRSTEQNILQYEVESSNDSINFIREAVIAAKNLTPENSYRFTENIRGIRKKIYRLRIVNNDGKWDNSKTIAVTNNSFPLNITYPSIIKNNLISFYISDAYDNLVLFGTNGTAVLNKGIRGHKGRMDITIPNLPKGIYLLKLSNNKEYVTQWIFID
jgi:glucose/arabinose dehydrogenase